MDVSPDFAKSDSKSNFYKGWGQKFEDPKKNASFKLIDCEFNAKK